MNFVPLWSNLIVSLNKWRCNWPWLQQEKYFPLWYTKQKQRINDNFNTTDVLRLNSLFMCLIDKQMESSLKVRASYYEESPKCALLPLKATLFNGYHAKHHCSETPQTLSCSSKCFRISSCFFISDFIHKGLPQWFISKKSACHCKWHRHGFDPWVGKILLEKEMAIQPSIFAWKIPWTEEPDSPQSLGNKELDTSEHTCIKLWR